MILRCVYVIVAFALLIDVEGRTITKTKNNVQELKKLTNTCTKPGYSCTSCNTVQLCLETDFGLISETLSCSGGETCLRGKCVKGRNPLCDGTARIQFECRMPGIFPDPFDCQKYHMCVLTNTTQGDDLNVKDFAQVCPDYGNYKFRYDPKSTYCKYEIPKGCDKWPVPLCNYVGEMGPLEENDSIYYVCVRLNGLLYPHLNVCPHGNSFDNRTGTCEDGIHTPPYPSTTAGPTTPGWTTTTGYPWPKTSTPTSTWEPTGTSGYPWSTTGRTTGTWEPTGTSGYPWSTTERTTGTWGPTGTTGYPWSTTSRPTGTWDPTGTTGYPWSTTSRPTGTWDPTGTTGYPWSTTSRPTGTWDPTGTTGNPWSTTERPTGTWDPTGTTGYPWSTTERPTGTWGPTGTT